MHKRSAIFEIPKLDTIIIAQRHQHLKFSHPKDAIYRSIVSSDGEKSIWVNFNCCNMTRSQSNKKNSLLCNIDTKNRVLKEKLPYFVNITGRTGLSDWIYSNISIPTCSDEGRLLLIGVPNDNTDGIKRLIFIDWLVLSGTFHRINQRANMKQTIA